MHKVSKGYEGDIVLAAHTHKSTPAFIPIRFERHSSISQLFTRGIILGTRHMDRIARSKS